MRNNRDFKGVWISRDIWFIQGLKPAYRVFIAEIDSLDNGDGCWAENAHFSEFFGLSNSRCSQVINMLEKMGLISIDFVERPGTHPKRILRVNYEKFPGQKQPNQPPLENERGALENERGALENERGALENERGALENETPLYKDEIYNEKYKEKYKERETRASDFLKFHFPVRFEQEFAMKYSARISDLKKFLEDFNDTVDQERLEYHPRVLFGRLGKYARNWIQNQEKYSQAQDYAPTQNLQRLV